MKTTYPTEKTFIARTISGIYVAYVFNLDKTRIKNIVTDEVFACNSIDEYFEYYYGVKSDFNKTMKNIIDDFKYQRAITPSYDSNPYNCDIDLTREEEKAEERMNKILQKAHKKECRALPKFRDSDVVTLDEINATLRYFENRDRENGCGYDAYKKQQAIENKRQQKLKDSERNLDF